jgi:hypothetical protein
LKAEVDHYNQEAGFALNPFVPDLSLNSRDSIVWEPNKKIYKITTNIRRWI